MAIFLLCFDASKADSKNLVDALIKIEGSAAHPSSCKIAEGAWAVVANSVTTAKDVWIVYRGLLAQTEPLSVIGLDAALRDLISANPQLEKLVA